MLALLLVALSTYHAPAVTLAYDGTQPFPNTFVGADTGMGRCYSMDQHWHSNDNQCHFDTDDSVVASR